MKRTRAAMFFLLAAAASSAMTTPIARGDAPPLIGINVREVNSPEARHLGITTREGAVITKVFAGYAADLAGLKAGDVVVGCGDQRVATCEDLQRMIRASTAGDRHRVAFHRGNRFYSVELTLGAAREQGSTPPSGAKAGREPYLGARLRSAGHREAIEVGIESPLGAAVIAVTPDAPMALAGLRQGDLIVSFAQQEVQTYEDLEAAVRRCSIGSRQKLVFVRGNRRYMATITIGSRAVEHPRTWYEHNGNEYRFLVPRFWSLASPIDPSQAAEGRYDMVTSTENAYTIHCFHASWKVTTPEAALKDFIREKLAHHGEKGHVSRFRLGEALGAAVGGYTTVAESRRSEYWICFVNGNRRYVFQAFGPPLAEVDRMPPVLADALGTIEFRRVAHGNDEPPALVGSPSAPASSPANEPSGPLPPGPPETAQDPARPVPPLSTSPTRPDAETAGPSPGTNSTGTNSTGNRPPSPASVAEDLPSVPNESYFANEEACTRERKALDIAVGRIASALQKKDVALATAAMHPAIRETYQGVFEERREDLARLAAVLATRKLVVITTDLAEYKVTEHGREFRISFEKHEGEWMLSSF